MAVIHSQAEIKAFILARIKIDAMGCWIWQGGVNNSGYATGLGHRGRGHRQAYEAWRGKIPEGMMLDHRCRVKACVNPQHMEPATRSQNVKYAVWAKNKQMSQKDLRSARHIHRLVGERHG